MNVAVVGGGISGLVRSYALVRAGHQVTLFEPAAPGGVIRTLRKDGFTLEQGPNVLLEKPEFARFVDELDLRSEVVYPVTPRYRQMVWWDGKAHQVPKSPLAFIRSPLVSRSAKLRLPSKLFRRSAVVVPTGDESDISVGALAEQLIGAEGVQRLVDPALKGIYGGAVYDLSARTILPELFSAMQTGASVAQFMRGRGKRSICVLRGGLRKLPERIMERIASHIELAPVMVDSVRRAGQVFEVIAGGISRNFEQLHLATSGGGTARIISEVAPELSDSLRSLRYASLAFIHFAAPRSAPVPRHCFGVLFSGERPSGLLGVMYNSELFPHVAPERYHLITVCVGGVGREPVVDRSDEDHVRWITADLKDLLGIDRVSPLAFQRWPRAIPQFPVGYATVQRQFEQASAAHPGLCFVGVDRGGVGVPDRVKAGLAL